MRAVSNRQCAMITGCQARKCPTGGDVASPRDRQQLSTQGEESLVNMLKMESLVILGFFVGISTREYDLHLYLCGSLDLARVL